ncbi:lamin tail domain-containing protein [uncultured Bacteroides sp.]|uniref:lamin tail domain-containing protein n=1 Tax=uncultured Bacteroides sp. TaxID=162156 RepID=UPI0025EE3639|nr:lamin tail domain-containing protein [uncultured Bacteroides sp.]
MKNYGVIALLCLFTTMFCNCSLPNDDDEELASEEDKITAELSWTGELDKFTINAKEGVHLNDPHEEGGTAYVTIPSSTVRSTRWEFDVHLTFNPSANNFARFYLVASSNILSDNLNGYYIQIGGAKDNVGLYRQNGNQRKLLASGRELMKGNNSPKLSIKVECDDNGHWTFWTRLDSELEYTKEKQVKDASIQSSLCCGIYCVYTKTRCKGFTFRQIQLSNDVETSTDADDPNEPINPDEPIEPILPDYPEEVKGMLLLNEVMYDDAENGAEYIELYNPSGSPVSVPSLKLIRYIDDGTVTTSAILENQDTDESLSIPSHGYICLTKSADALLRKHKVEGATIIEITKFPRISNEGGHLAIQTNEEKPRLIDKCSYNESMHNSGKKRNQGISLEKKSPELPSSIMKNWTSSKNTTGGTPGIKNSQE